MRLKRILAPAILALLVAAPSAHAQKDVTVEAQDNVFAPADISIQAGDTITFRNTGQAAHTAQDKAGSFNTGNLNAGESKAITFSKEGTFQLICLYHEAIGMVGRIVVGAAGAASPSPESPAPSPTPAPLPTEAAFDPDEGVPIGMKVFPFVAGGLLLLLILAIGLGYIRNVQKTTES